MLSVSEALGIVMGRAQALPPEELPLTTAVLGLVLAEDVASDLDMPPFDKALMDGYALRTADLAAGQAQLTVVEEVSAGQTPQRSLEPGQCTRIMTGAPLPLGADAVVMHERTRALREDLVHVEDRSLSPGRNVLGRGREMKEGETVLAAGSVLRPQELGLLATVGRTSIKVYPPPRVAVLSTGDEVVEPTETPGPGQIRNGNGSALMALVSKAGGLPRYLGIGKDNLDSLRPLVAEGLGREVLVLSGGVSAGKRDLVPEVLTERGVQAHFHKVEMKPGKPVFFGTLGQTLVFGLPGNPVSALVCFELFVRPALAKLGGHPDSKPRMVPALLSEDFSYNTDRPTYHPARLDENEETRRVRPVPWFGSADLRALSGANGFVLLPPGNHQHRAGQRFEVLKLED